MKRPRPLTGLLSNQGSVLLAAACFTTVLALVLGSYITMCYQSLQMSSRNMQATHSVELAELGLEDALWAQNEGDWSNWSISANTARETLSGFSYDNGSTGAVTVTVTDFDNSHNSRTVTSAGTLTLSDGSNITRTVSTGTQLAPVFTNAVAALTAVKFKKGGSVDSYDSSLGDYSTQTHSASAIISGTTVTLTDAQIYGYVATAGTAPTISSIGTVKGPNTAAGVKVDTTRVSTSPFQNNFDVLAANGAGDVLPSGSATLGAPSDTTPHIYYAGDVTLSGSNTLTISGPVVIAIAGTLTIQNSASIVVAATGTLDIRLDGDLALGGNGIVNNTKQPARAAILGTAGNNNGPQVTTTTPFYGVIYMLSDNLTVTSNATIYGALVAKNVTFNNAPTIHYDINLRNAVFPGINTPYSIAQWKE